MRSTAPIKTAKIGYIILSALLCALGILLIVHPSFSVSAIGVAAGVLMILFGIFKIIGYFSRDLFRLAFQYDLAFGILLIALGIIVLTRPVSVMNFICIAIGISILADGLFKIQISADSRKFGLGSWWIILTFAILACAVGLLLILRPSGSAKVLVMLLGASILAEGLLNFVTVLCAVKIIRHQQPDTIEVHDFTERKD